MTIRRREPLADDQQSQTQGLVIRTEKSDQAAPVESDFSRPPVVLPQERNKNETRKAWREFFFFVVSPAILGMWFTIQGRSSESVDSHLGLIPLCIGLLASILIPLNAAIYYKYANRLVMHLSELTFSFTVFALVNAYILKQMNPEFVQGVQPQTAALYFAGHVYVYNIFWVAFLVRCLISPPQFVRIILNRYLDKN